MKVKKSVIMAIAATFVGVSSAANILVNPKLIADQADVPPFWDMEAGKSFMSVGMSLGPGGMPAVKFSARQGAGGEVRLRQHGLVLATNGVYRLSCKVRAKDYTGKGKDSGFLILTQGWKKSFGIHFRSGTYDWTPFTSTVTVEPSTEHSAILYLADFEGEIAIADLDITPADDRTARETGESKYVAINNELRLVPLEPLLWSVPEEHPFLVFRLFGKLPSGNESDYEIRARTEGIERTYACSKASVEVEVSPQRQGGRLEIALADRLTGKCVHSRTFEYRTVPTTPPHPNARRLNTLVSELVNADLALGSSGRYAFNLERRGWVFVSAAASVRIDGDVCIGSGTPCQETVRELEAGRHVLEVCDAKGGRVVLRRIPEIFDYCPCAGVISAAPPFDWAFQTNYVMPSLTTFNGGKGSNAELSFVRKAGRLWLSNTVTSRLKDAQDLQDRLAKSLEPTDDCYDGTSCDEEFYSNPNQIAILAEGLWRYRAPKGKRIYTWAVGNPQTSGCDVDFVAATVNASCGKGRLLCEAYCSTCESEEIARGHLKDRLGGAVEALRRAYPAAIPRFGLIMGAYSQYPRMSLLSHSEVDHRYYLDMQFNLIANDPTFSGIDCVGVWGSYYADDELQRWIFRLTRHYFIEGRKDMLSKTCGLSYIPAHVIDGDFRNGLEKWRTDGMVKAVTCPGLALGEGRLYCPPEVGDNSAVLVRTSESHASVSQTMKGLLPGELYSVRFAVFNPTLPRRTEEKVVRMGVDVRFDARASLVREYSWEHDDRQWRRDNRGHDTRVDFRHVVFRAHAAEAELTIDNKASEPGQSYGINAVVVKRYHPRTPITCNACDSMAKEIQTDVCGKR